MKNKIVAFIHAKGSSERVPEKNLKRLGNQPLFGHAILTAKGSELISDVVIDSDAEEILQKGEALGAIPLRRPAELADNTATGDDLAYWQASNYPDADIVMQVIPTSPFIRPASLDKAIRLLDEKQVNSVAGVFREVFYEWTKGKPSYLLPDGRIPNSTEKDPLVYETTGLYINRTAFVLEYKKRLDVNSCAPYFLSRMESVDINTPEDFEFAEILWKGLHAS